MQDDELLAAAEAAENEWRRRARRMTDFRYDEQQEKYWDLTTNILLGAKSVDGAIPQEDWPVSSEGKLIAPSREINAVDTGLTVEGSTWWPGKPQLIRDVVVNDRGVMAVPGAVTFNTYMEPPELDPAGDPQPWIDHVRLLWPDEADHFFNYCAHMVQRPHEKINHGVVLAGGQGVGKDTALLPLRMAVGEWNTAEIEPDAVTEAYNGYARSVLLIINEVRPHDHEFKSANFYNKLKPLLAAPPETLPMTLKYQNTTYIRNLCHVVLTTNDPLTMYAPEEDRRLFVMTAAEDRSSLGPTYFSTLYSRLASGAVKQWLLRRDISKFDPAAPPPMTVGKEQIVSSARELRRTIVDDILDSYTEAAGFTPAVIFHRDVLDFVRESGLFDDEDAAKEKIRAKNFHFKMADRGYDMLRNPAGSEWKRGKFRSRAAFVLKSVAKDERLQKVMEELERRPLTWEKLKAVS